MTHRFDTMPGPLRILALGEAMVELAPAEGGLWQRGFAGDTLNTAWYLRALLPHDWAVDFYTMVGNDPLSDAMVDFIEDAGIGTSRIARHPERTPGLYMIHLQNGERSFSYWRDTSAARCMASDPVRLAAACDGADVLYFSGITLAILDETSRRTFLKTITEARGRGARVAFDPNLRPRLWRDERIMCQTVSEAAGQADLILPSFDDEARYFGDATPDQTAHRYLTYGASEVVVKNGGGPMAIARSGTSPRMLPAPPPVQPVDTTGAGDSFNAAYLAARLTGGEPDEAITQGHRLATQIIARRGALIPHSCLCQYRGNHLPAASEIG